MMVVATFKFYLSNSLTSETVLANSIDEAEDYLRVLQKNGIYKIHNLNIEHSYIVGNPTNFKVISRDKEGNVEMLEWIEKGSQNCGRVKLWTMLPPRIKQNVQKKERAA